MHGILLRGKVPVGQQKATTCSLSATARRTTLVRTCRNEERRANMNLTNNFKWRISSSDLEEVDPMTGEIISGSSLASRASKTVTTGTGYTWAFREEGTGSSDRLPIVCLHGLGSCSFTYRRTVNLLAQDGFRAIALDWIGHGQSSVPPATQFGYSSEEYISELGKAIDSLNLGDSFALVVHGYVLGQIGMLYAARHPDKVKKLVCLNVPLGLKSKLRPELAAYKAPLAFMRPKEDSIFDGRYYNAAGGPYALSASDADAYNTAYEESPAASAAIYHTMDKLDWKELLEQVNEAFYTWTNPALLIHGSSDTFLDLGLTLDWLESKRTCMKMSTGIEAKLGHVPQEDYPEAIHPAIRDFMLE
jgi:pimeloyl-ACP methyl ester carboxylesterase